MKAIVYDRYGSPDVLRYEEVDRPVPGDGEVLIRVRAAALNPIDWHFMRGAPYGFRFMSGLTRPKATRLGMDMAGRVEAVGAKVTRWKPADEVFGAGRGAFAEFACVPESQLAMKPAHVSFEQAASSPVAGLTALQGLRDKGHLQAGQKVLINGASGGVGTFAVQIAKALGADVTGVCSTRNVEMVRGLGADRVMDYTREDFTASGERWDVILDCIGNHALSACRRALSGEGICVLVGAPSGRWIAPMGRFLGARVTSKFSAKKLTPVLATPTHEDLERIAGMMESGKVTPVVDRRYRLSEAPEGIRYLEEGHARGKVVIAVEPDKTER